ncbi:MAG TPA: hypothetical protein VFW98_16945 [Gemmatimonadaceae bacterium]|nr:hypothetical protein [Gemmatimonadaceae bacterium]
MHRHWLGIVLSRAADEHDAWWLGGDNVPNPNSRRLFSGRYWRIRRPIPWPQVIGTSLWMKAPADLEPGGEVRIPDAGEFTSAVRHVEAMLWADSPTIAS